MPYNTSLEERIDAAVANWRNMEKKKMFGGLCYLLKGNMCFGVWKDFLIVRMDKEEGERRLRDKHVRPFDITGKPMAGWLMIEAGGWKGATGLQKWLEIGKRFASSLPEKKGKGTARKTKTLRDYRA